MSLSVAILDSCIGVEDKVAKWNLVRNKDCNSTISGNSEHRNKNGVYVSYSALVASHLNINMKGDYYNEETHGQKHADMSFV